MHRLVLIFAVLVAAPGLAELTPDQRAARLGEQWVTTYAVLDHLADAAVEGPHLPAKKVLYANVDKERKKGTTVQNPWGGDGPNRYMHVRVRKTRVDRVMKDLRDCLVVPLVGRISFDLDVLPGSVLLFAPEFVRQGAAGARMRVLADGQELWSAVLPGRSLFKNTWDEVRIPLDYLANKTVKLTFEVDKPSLGEKRWERRGKHKGVGLFAMPRVLTRLAASNKALRGKVKSLVGDEMNHNVIMVVFDSMRADLMSPVREERGRLPAIAKRLEAFTESGVRFKRAFSVGNQTRIGSYSFYLASPPAANGFWSIKWGLSDTFRKAFYAAKPVSIARVLHDAGYLVGHLGFNGFLTGFQYLSLDMGFDFVGEFNGVPENTVRMTEGINEWLEAHKNQKFFLLIWFDPPHFPYNPPASYLKQLHAAGVAPDDTFYAQKYLAKMMYGDEYFGKIADKLTALGLDKKTLFIVTGDHGEAMDLRHDGYSHNADTRIARHHGKTLYDEEVHVPLAMRLDGVLEKRTVDAQVSLMSLGPTIVDLLGLKARTNRWMGTSFAKLLRGLKEAKERVVYFEARWSYGIRAHGYKYIFHDKPERLKLNRESLWDRRRDGTDEIFDVTADPYELTNIATTHPEVRAKMRKTYFDLRETMRAFYRAAHKGTLSRPIVENP